jgi:hypothetical protein
MQNALVVIAVGLIVSGPSLTAAARPDQSSTFKAEAPLNRDGPQLTVEVVQQPAISNSHYDIHVTTTAGLHQHLEIRNGQPLTPKDVRLADVNGDGFLDLMVVGGKDHRGEDWFKTWLYDPKSKKYKWINES